jgi:hypothetical protein
MYKKIIFILLLVVNIGVAQEVKVIKAVKAVTLSGYTRSYKKALITPEVNGKLIKFNYKIGETINKKPLVEIDDTFIRIDIANMKNQIESNDMEIKKIKSKIKFFKKDYLRKKKLKEKGRTSEINYDNAVLNLEQAELTLNSLNIQKEILRANLSKLLEKLKRYKIFVPDGWILTNKFSEKIEIVSPAKPIAEIADYHILTVPLSVNNIELENIRKIKKIKGYIEGEPVFAELNYINPKFNEKTRKTDIELVIKNYNKMHRGGLLFSFNLNIVLNAYKIDKKAIDYSYNLPRIYPVNSNKPINIKIIDSEDDFEIIKKAEGLKPGLVLKILNK